MISVWCCRLSTDLILKRAGDGVPQHLGDVEEEKCGVMDVS